MRLKTVFSIFFLLLLYNLQAQFFNKITVGKNIEATSVVTIKTHTEMQGFPIDIVMEETIVRAIHVDSVTTKLCNMTAIIKKISGTYSGMGHKSKFNSTDFKLASDTTSWVYQLFRTIVGANEKISITPTSNDSLPDVTITNPINNYSFAKRLVLPLTTEQMKQYYHWRDTLDWVDGKKYTAEHSVTDITANEIRVGTSIFLNHVPSYEYAPPLKTQIKKEVSGRFIYAKIYNKSNGLLRSETIIINLTGAASAYDISMPLTMEGTIITTVMFDK